MLLPVLRQPLLCLTRQLALHCGGVEGGGEGGEEVHAGEVLRPEVQTGGAMGERGEEAGVDSGGESGLEGGKRGVKCREGMRERGREGRAATPQTLSQTLLHNSEPRRR